jgi:hypothetical protein
MKIYFAFDPIEREDKYGKVPAVVPLVSQRTSSKF